MSNPWLYVLIFVLVITGGSILLAAIYGLFIAAIGSRFSEKTLNKYCGQIGDVLPGKNCKECGFDNCSECAWALLRAEVDDSVCPHVSQDDQKKIAEIRESLQKIMTDPTPVKKKKKSFWNRKR